MNIVLRTMYIGYTTYDSQTPALHAIHCVLRIMYDVTVRRTVYVVHRTLSFSLRFTARHGTISYFISYSLRNTLYDICEWHIISIGVMYVYVLCTTFAAHTAVHRTCTSLSIHTCNRYIIIYVYIYIIIRI